MSRLFGSLRGKAYIARELVSLSREPSNVYVVFYRSTGPPTTDHYGHRLEGTILVTYRSRVFSNARSALASVLLPREPSISSAVDVSNSGPIDTQPVVDCYFVQRLSLCAPLERSSHHQARFLAERKSSDAHYTRPITRLPRRRAAQVKKVYFLSRGRIAVPYECMHTCAVPDSQELLFGVYLSGPISLRFENVGEYTDNETPHRRKHR